jgi:membrane fusion protein (multidrug efflux system)
MLQRREAARAKAPGLVPEEEVETVRTQVARLEAQVQEAVAAASETRAAAKESEAALAEARGRATIAARDADDARVRPPLAGVVQTRHVTLGQWVLAGTPVATLLDLSRLRLRFRVPEEESTALVPRNSEIAFRVAAIPGREMTADLIHVQGTADPVTRMVECLAEVRDPPADLKPGVFASVTATVRRRSAAVVLPEEAVLATEKGLVAYAVREGKVAEIPLRTGLRTADGWVEILEGVEEGTQIAVENAAILADGIAVETFPSARAKAPPAPGPAR